VRRARARVINAASTSAAPSYSCLGSLKHREFQRADESRATRRHRVPSWRVQSTRGVRPGWKTNPGGTPTRRIYGEFRSRLMRFQTRARALKRESRAAPDAASPRETTTLLRDCMATLISARTIASVGCEREGEREKQVDGPLPRGSSRASFGGSISRLRLDARPILPPAGGRNLKRSFRLS